MRERVCVRERVRERVCVRERVRERVRKKKKEKYEEDRQIGRAKASAKLCPIPPFGPPIMNFEDEDEPEEGHAGGHAVQVGADVDRVGLLLGQNPGHRLLRV